MNICKFLIAENRLVDLYKLARFTYRVGEPIMNDTQYEVVNKAVIDNNLSDLHKQTYDDDEIPYELLNEFKLNNLIYKNNESREKYLQYLDGEKSLSIRSVETYKDAYEFFMNSRGVEKIISTKVNGINTKSLYVAEEDSKLAISMSRGRKGNGFDLTKNISRVIPVKLQNAEYDVTVFCEAYVENSKLAIVSEGQKDTLVTERSGAISMLRRDYPDSAYNHLKVLAFNAEGLSNKISRTLEILKDNNFEVVPYRVIGGDEVPTDYSEFCIWIKSLMDTLYKEQVDREIPADGLVVQINDLNFDDNVKAQYSDRNVALKFEHWSYKYYKGIVKKIIIEQKAVNCSIRLEIHPIKTEDNCQARFVNAHSLGILVSEGIVEGSEIYFERNSGAINILLYGQKLKQLLG